MRDTSLGFLGGALCGVALSYLCHWPLTYGQVTILIVVGVVLAVRGCRIKGKIARLY
jgi:CDP-diglyceride synthetase